MLSYHKLTAEKPFLIKPLLSKEQNLELKERQKNKDTVNGNDRDSIYSFVEN